MDSPLPMFDDILEPRRSTSDFFWSVYDGGISAPAAAGNDGDAAKNAVLSSTRLREMIETLAREACNNTAGASDQTSSCHPDDEGGNSAVSSTSYQEKIAELYTDAVRILNEMGHQFGSSTIRLMGFMLSKVFKRLYTHIWVDRSGIEELRRRMAHMHHATGSGRSGKCPVILVPTHRSYVDFLVLSFVLFTYNLQVPLIVAGIDFLKMSFVAHMLRQSGAFFIRRSFSDDRLYWTLFADYVQELLRIDSHPLEFFIEGTRSRSGKPLYPRIGMLNVVGEMWIKGRIYDACFVPVTIEYDRPLEESLHIREVLGHAKPQESTTALVKAMSILRENFGSVRVSFHHPLMLRDSIVDGVDRSQLNLMPLFKSVGVVSPQSELGESLNRFGLQIVIAQTRQMGVTPFHLLCALILQQLPYTGSSVPNGLTTSSVATHKKSFSFSWLSHRVLCAWRLMEKLDNTLTRSFIAERDQDPVEHNTNSAEDAESLKQQQVVAASTVAMLDDELRRACHIHHNLLSLEGGFVTLSLSNAHNSSSTTLRPLQTSSGSDFSLSKDQSLPQSAPRPSLAGKSANEAEQDDNVYMLLAFYRNHLMALRPVATAALRCLTGGDQHRYELLCDMFSREFVCTALQQPSNSTIAKNGVLDAAIDDVDAVKPFPEPDMLPTSSKTNTTADDSLFLTNLIMPFAKTYYIIMLALLQFSSNTSCLPPPTTTFVNGIACNMDVAAGGDTITSPPLQTPPAAAAPCCELRCTSVKAFTKHLQNLVRQLIFDKQVSNEREMLSLDTIANAINWLKFRRLLTIHHRVDADEGVYIAVVCNNLKELERYTVSLRSILLSSSSSSTAEQQRPVIRNGKPPALSSGSDDFVGKLDNIDLGSILMNLAVRFNKDSVTRVSAEKSSVLLHGKL